MLFRLYRGRRHRFDTPLSERIHKVCRGEQSRNGFFVEFALTCIREEVEVLTTILTAIILKLVSLHKIRTEILYGLLSLVYGKKLRFLQPFWQELF